MSSFISKKKFLYWLHYDADLSSRAYLPSVITCNGCPLAQCFGVKVSEDTYIGKNGNRFPLPSWAKDFVALMDLMHELKKDITLHYAWNIMQVI